MRVVWVALKTFLFFTILTGVAYPLLVTGIAQVFAPDKANGSLVKREGKIVGSKLIGQKFDSGRYFMSRPSSVSYNPLPSGGSNYSLTNKKLKILVKERKQQFIAFNQLDSITPIPSEMLFASASGLDPHISQKAALLQVNRIAKARNLTPVQKQRLTRCIQECTEEPQLLVFGEKRVNVLILNLKINYLFQNNTNN